MGFNFMQAKARLRQAVHDTLAVDASFQYTSTSVPLPIKARYHNRLVKEGQVENAGAEVYENVDQVVFCRDEINAIGIYPERLNIVTFNFPGSAELRLVLDYRLQSDGPTEEKWAVMVE